MCAMSGIKRRRPGETALVQLVTYHCNVSLNCGHLFPILLNWALRWCWEGVVQPSYGELKRLCQRLKPALIADEHRYHIMC